ncbi:MAG TPA: phosphate ABC transporter substrate-binding protein PstS [Polyangia bacterium]|nr:phosphate ABC transporter substrate-binding protein PstS [Polyangia bacterium]
MKTKTTSLATCVALAGVAAVAFAAESTISGAGATFPYPLYSKWADAYANEAQIKLNYQAIGSGGGIKQITEGTVDFGASDAPLKPEELDKAGLTQFPVVMGGVAPVVNLASVKSGELKLTPALLADIFLGKVKKWSDPKLAAANAGLKLPDTAITIVHRSDGSGTTWIFTNYLGKVSPEWAKSVGNDKSVSWPVGVGGKGNQGVASYVQRIPGSIGYVETAYATQNHMTEAKLENRSGAFVAADDDSVQAAAKGADWKSAKSFYVVLTDEPGAGAWPITGATFVLMHRKQKRADVAREVLKFFDWGYRSGGKAAKELGYVPMPQAVIELVEKSWQNEIKDESGGGLWPAERHAAR